MSSRARPGTPRLIGIAVLTLAALLGLLVAVGLLITGALQNVPPVSVEDEIVQELAAARTPTATAVSSWVSPLGSTEVVVAVTVVLVVVLRALFRRWRESAFLALVVSSQALVFLLTTLVVRRSRPPGVQLDAAPPTSSFPSGHTGAATALYVATAMVVAWHTRRVWARRSLVVALLAVPVAVGLARIYRGMHHPSDVLAALANGCTCAWVWARALLLRVPRRPTAPAPPPGRGVRG